MKIFDKQYLLNILWNGDYEDIFEIGQSRWSSYKEMIFKDGDKYYAAEYSEGLSESQCEAPFEYSEDKIGCNEVCQIPVLTKKWVTLDKVSNKLKQIKDDIEHFLNREDAYIYKIENEIETIYDIIDYVNEKFKVNLDVHYVGGFDSTGFRVSCYAWAGIIDGQLYFDSFEEEEC